MIFTVFFAVFWTVAALQGRLFHQVGSRMGTSFAKIVLTWRLATHKRWHHLQSHTILPHPEITFIAVAAYQLSSVVILGPQLQRPSPLRLGRHWRWRAVLVSCRRRLTTRRMNRKEGSVLLVNVFSPCCFFTTFLHQVYAVWWLLPHL